MGSTKERENYVYIAKLAKQAGRYDEMVEAMKNLAKLDVKLTVEERSLLSAGYKNVIGSKRATWKILSSIEQKEEWKGNELNVKRIRDYRQKVESELSTICSDIITVINEYLIPSSKAGESTAFYYKMKGDFYRYLAEIKSGSERKEAADQSMKAYEFVLILQGSMPSTTTSSSTTPELIESMPFGFAGAGVESFPAIDKTPREESQILEEKSLQRKKRNYDSANISKHIENSQMNFTSDVRTLYKDDVDEKVARFFYAGGLNVNIVNSPYFREMLKAVGAFGPRYELPSREMSDFYLSKEKAKLEKAINLIRESWPHTGCTIICVNRVGCINLFVSSRRGVMFMQSIDINEGEGADSLFINVLSDAIMEIGPVNVLQIITHLGKASFSFESTMSSKFPHIFWSGCTSHSIHILLEEIAELEWMKAVVLCARGIEKTVLSYQFSSSHIIYDAEENSNALFLRFAPSYCLVQRIHQMKEALQELFITNDWKQWKVTASDDAVYIEEAVLGDEFWSRAELMLHLCRPFVTLLATFNIDKSNMGDVYNWKVQSLEAVKSKGIDDIVLHHLELLIDSRWDTLFSPLHAASYMLNPRYFGRGQVKDKTVMRGWKATLERYEPESAARRLLREQLSIFWRVGGSFGGEDAIECRDRMDPVAWWETFGFETPNLQKLAIKVLSQVSSVSFYQENILCELSGGQVRKEMRILYLSETILAS